MFQVFIIEREKTFLLNLKIKPLRNLLKRHKSQNLFMYISHIIISIAIPFKFSFHSSSSPVFIALPYPMCMHILTGQEDIQCFEKEINII